MPGCHRRHATAIAASLATSGQTAKPAPALGWSTVGSGGQRQVGIQACACADRAADGDRAAECFDTVLEANQT